MKRESATAIVLTLLVASMLFSAINFVKGQTYVPDLAVSLSSFNPPVINRTYNHLTNGNTTVLNATVTNIGNFSASEVTLQLWINHTMVLSAYTPWLDPGQTFWAAYFWDTSINYSPPITDCNLTVYAPPVSGEENVSNNNGTWWVRVCPDQPPIASFNMSWSPPNPVSPPGPVENQSVTFDASSSYNPPSTPPDWSPIVNYNWSFGDHNTTICPSPTITHQYKTWGNYTVTLTLLNNENLINTSAPQNISVYSRPIANFTIAAGKRYVNQDLTFDSSTSIDPDDNATYNKGIATYNWDFGDGNTTSCPNPTILHSYSTNGSYTIILNVTDRDGLVSDPVNQSVNIGLGQPIALFTHTPPPQLCYVGFDLTFDATNSYDPDNDIGPPTHGIANYTWNFGDGNITTVNGWPIILHLYTSPGDYHVNLNVSDSDQGLTDSTTAIVSVSYQVFLSVVDSVTGSPEIIHNASEDFYVNITVTNVTDLFSYDVKLTWPGTNAYPIFTGASGLDSGHFLDQGAQEDFEPLGGPAPAQGYVNVSSVRTHSSVGVNGSGTLFIMKFHVNDTMTGNCTVRISSYWLNNSANVNIPCTLVNGDFYTPEPVANFTYSPYPPEIPTVNTTVYFTASGSYKSYCPDGGPIAAYNWDFGDGKNGTGPTTSHNYTGPGSFNVNLTVTDGISGLTWSMNKTVQVSPGQVVVNDIVPDERRFNSTFNVFETAWKLNITLTVQNVGVTPVTFNLTVFFGPNSTATELITDLQPGNATYVFSCSIADSNLRQIIPKGDYNISAEASCTNGTYSWTGPTLTNGTVRVYPLGDVSRDNITDLSDAIRISNAMLSQPGDSNWDLNADLNCDDFVDLSDAEAVSANFLGN